ncbi:MAG: hypothetical protein LBL96_02100 [Clostridiales bacterium]|jgi:YD repeat-containing protein|nr:hypothetical protein [Clostridiales bacterium]
MENNPISTADAPGRMTQKTDPAGNVKTMDALGNSSTFSYDEMNRLTSVDMGGDSSADDSQRITLYQYDKRGLVTKEINALGDGKLYTYDSAGNLLTQVDEDGYVTEYMYDSQDLVAEINYNGAKSALYAYNKTGQLVVEDWTGTTSFTLDALNHIESVIDANDRKTSYVYDEVGNKKSMTYVYDETNR